VWVGWVWAAVPCSSQLMNHPESTAWYRPTIPSIKSGCAPLPATHLATTAAAAAAGSQVPVHQVPVPAGVVLPGAAVRPRQGAWPAAGVAGPCGQAPHAGSTQRWHDRWGAAGGWLGSRRSLGGYVNKHVSCREPQAGLCFPGDLPTKKRVRHCTFEHSMTARSLCRICNSVCI
jgi:hypothetical protein